MRIISGKYRGLIVPMPAHGNIRPTTDRAREALFNILSHSTDLSSCRVLDLFAGSGAVSVEFASRGAAEVVCVEKNPATFRDIHNFLKLKSIEEVRPIRADAIQYLKTTKEQFDLIFADPPYADSSVSALPQLILESDALRDGGIFILEHESKLIPEHPAKYETRNYGQSVFSFFRK